MTGWDLIRETIVWRADQAKQAIAHLHAPSPEVDECDEMVKCAYWAVVDFVDEQRPDEDEWDDLDADDFPRWVHWCFWLLMASTPFTAYFSTQYMAR